MIDLTTPIIPYEGTGIFKLNSTYDEVTDILKKQNVPYNEEIDRPNDIDPAWTMLTISDDNDFEAVELFFAKGRLFKICLYEDFVGSLPNGIHTGMTIQDAKQIDKNLKQNEDWDEIYESPDGYWIEYSNFDLKVTIITIFIPAVEREDFYDYNW